jgi:hypothetical protein
VHRLSLAAIRIAAKALEDNKWSQQRVAQVGGVSPTQLLNLEVALCFLLDFELGVDAEGLAKSMFGLQMAGRSGGHWDELGVGTSNDKRVKNFMVWEDFEGLFMQRELLMMIMMITVVCIGLSGTTIRQKRRNAGRMIFGYPFSVVLLSIGVETRDELKSILYARWVMRFSDVLWQFPSLIAVSLWLPTAYFGQHLRHEKKKAHRESRPLSNTTGKFDQALQCCSRGRSNYL